MSGRFLRSRPRVSCPCDLLKDVQTLRMRESMEAPGNWFEVVDSGKAIFQRSRSQKAVLPRTELRRIARKEIRFAEDSEELGID
jgi:hypothetical protein